MKSEAEGNIFQALNRYVNDVFAELIVGENWLEAEMLPMYLQAGFSYREANLQGQHCLLMLDREGEQGDKASTLKKYIQAVSKHFTGPIIYVVQQTASFNRKRLIDQRIAFIVPGKQLYLPFMAMDLRENFAASRANEKQKKLGAVAQQLLLLHLYQRLSADLPAQVMAERLGVSKMTVSRAYSELASCGLATNRLIGRKKQLEFVAGGQELWQKAQPFLVNPVRKTVWIDRDDYEQHQQYFADAGETALAEIGMMMTPKHYTAAVNYADWPGLKKLLKLHEQDQVGGETVVVQLWRYDPKLLDERCIDPLSLYLSLDAEHDDRIDIAKDELLKKTWDRFL